MVVEGELHCRQPLCPIVLEVVNIGMEVHLNLLIHLLCLSICLWMESSTWVCLYPNHGIEFLHEMGYELGALLTHNFVWDSMVLEHLISEDACCAESSEVSPNSFNQRLHCELINDDEDGIVPM